MFTAAKCNCFTTAQVQKLVGPLNSMKDAAILTDLYDLWDRSLPSKPTSSTLVLNHLPSWGFLLNMKMLKKTHHYTQKQEGIMEERIISPPPLPPTKSHLCPSTL